MWTNLCPKLYWGPTLIALAPGAWGPTLIALAPGPPPWPDSGPLVYCWEEGWWNGPAPLLYLKCVLQENQKKNYYIYRVGLVV